MKIHLLRIFLLTYCLAGNVLFKNLFAQDVSREQAIQIAVNFFNSATKEQKTTGQISSVTPVMDNLFVAYYTVNFNPEGWVIIAGNQKVLPIIGFNKTGKMDMNNINPEAKFVLDYHKDEILAMRNAISPRNNESARIEAYWALYIEKTPSQSVLAVKTLDPLMRSTWDQGIYYNEYCPDLPQHSCGPDGKAWAGCVAVAMGQIMNYYRWPTSPRGYHTYNDPHRDPNCGTGSPRKLDFGTVSYYWPNVQDKLTNYNKEVALLLYSCGISVDMDYEGNGSGAYSEKIPNSLKKFFSYTNGGTLLSKSNYSNSSWEAMILNELNDNRPVYYAGTKKLNASGHAFVIDGYYSDESQQKNGSINLFHINYGWGGASNGFYRLTGGLNNTEYSQSMKMITRLYAVKPTEPTGVLASDNLNDKIIIRWADHEMGYYYQVYRGSTTDPAKMMPISGWQKQNYFEDFSAQPGIKYYYTIRAATTDGGTWVSPFSQAKNHGTRLQQCKCNNSVEDICENFEGYKYYENIGYASPCWTTWSGIEGTLEDAQVLNSPDGNGAALVFDPNRNLGALQDVVLQLGNRTSGNYELKFNMWIPSTKAAYFNLMHKFTPAASNNIWACEISFGTSVTGSLKVGNTKIGFTYPKNKWFPVQILIDVNNQKANLLVNNKSVYSWTFSWSNTSKSKVSNQLAALNFYTINSGYQFYVDEINFKKLNNLDDDKIVIRSADEDKQEILDNSKVDLINYPNPFKDMTNIQFSLSNSAKVGLYISDLSGKRLSNLIIENSDFEPGEHKVTFDGSDLQNGIYLAVLTINGKVQVRKLLLNRPGYTVNERIRSTFLEAVTTLEIKESVPMGEEDIDILYDKTINSARSLLKASKSSEALALLTEFGIAETSLNHGHLEWLTALAWLLIDKDQALYQIRKLASEPNHIHRIEAINLLKKLE